MAGFEPAFLLLSLRKLTCFFEKSRPLWHYYLLEPLVKFPAKSLGELI